MKICSDEIPQADKLHEVADVAAAVAAGATTFQEIATHIGKVERQGRYYRKAAEIIGFTRSVGLNYSEITPLGASWVAADATNRRQILVQAVLGTRLFQRLIPFLESHPQGVTRGQLMAFLNNVADLGKPSMVQRRVATFTHWLIECGLVREVGLRYLLNPLPAYVPYVDYSLNEMEPLLPTAYGLTDYTTHEQIYKQRQGQTTYLVDQAKMERANVSHRALLNLVAARVKATGSVPKVGKLIDLAAVHSGQKFIFEMKSTTPENTRSQVRQGISQLYEYRYIEQAQDARLVLVLENPLAGETSWMRDYLLQDRNVLVLWDGDGNLYCPASSQVDLGFLNPVAV